MSPSATTPASSAAAFLAFRDDLDEHNDRRERLIKCSRDITIASKRVVFLLHRIMTEAASDGRELSSRAAAEGHKKLRDVQALFANIREEVRGDRFWRYQHNISPGLQEYIEALSFAHYLEHGTLITYDEVHASLTDESGSPYFPLPVSDYLLGVSDLTGELMRFAISSISKRGGRTKASEVSNFVRGCKADFEGFTPHIRDLSKKQAVTSQSLRKIEEAAYAIVVRSSEYDLTPEQLDDIVGQAVSGHGDAFDEPHGSGRRRGRGENSDEFDEY
ncbi:Translin [Auriscalpium vulgare]|uniref:Translin n=1 Tax=Auriscalpium vulgare TaxID=40419 RepID=A0ACB8S471_9AGAM|nr:Translin [Auriscalpium vulgare]